MVSSMEQASAMCCLGRRGAEMGDEGYVWVFFHIGEARFSDMRLSVMVSFGNRFETDKPGCVIAGVLLCRSR